MDTTTPTPPPATPATPPPPGVPPVPPTPETPQDPAVPPVPPPAAPEAPAMPPVPPPPPAQEVPAVPPQPLATPESPAVPVPPPPGPEATAPGVTPPPPGEPTLGEPKVDPAPSAAAQASGAPTSVGAADTSKDAPVATPPGDDHKKAVSKPILLAVGFLVIGAISAVFLVANMKPGETQNYASTPTKAPALPRSLITPSVAVKDPNLTIMSPQPNAELMTPSTTVTGKTFPNAEVFVNEAQTKANTAGVFTTKVSLDEGENIITISTNDENGNSAEQELTVTYTPTE